MILLVSPPVSKPCEPPAGLVQLTGALRTEGVPYRLIDANLDGILYLAHGLSDAHDTWTKRAIKNLPRHLEGLRSIDLYRNFDRYKRAVSDMNHLLEKSASRTGIRMSLEDYEDPSLSPTKTADLLHSAEHPETNPFHPYFRGPLREIIDREQPDFIGISLTYLSQALCTLAMTGFIRKQYPNVKIIFGGGLLTSWMKNPLWENPFTGLADHLVCGPGEQALLTILGKDVSSHTVYAPSFDFKDNSEPAYLAPGLVTPYSTSSGCYWGKCTFCPETAEKNRYIQRAPETISRELKNIVEETKPVLIHLTDNAVSPAALRELSLHPPGAPWYGFVRVTDHLTDPDFCAALRNSGCTMLKLGVESGNQNVLDAMNKGQDVLTVSRSLKTLSKAGIATYVYLLFGTPYESRDEALDTLHFVVSHNRFVDFLNVAVFNLPLCSPDAESLVCSRFYEGDLSLYSNFIHPRGWDRKTVRSFLDREFKKHPAIRPIIMRQPPFFTSNHAPFFSKLFLS